MKSWILGISLALVGAIYAIALIAATFRRAPDETSAEADRVLAAGSDGMNFAPQRSRGDLVVLNAGPPIISVWRTRHYPNADPDYRSTEAVELEIVGSGMFVDRIHEAIKLLEYLHPAGYELVCGYVQQVRECTSSHVSRRFSTARVCVSLQTAMPSLTWCASVLVHESYHVKLALDDDFPDAYPQPAGGWTRASVEMLCNSAQYEALKAMDAPSHEINWILAQDGTHGDLNKDGEYTWDEYLKYNN